MWARVYVVRRESFRFVDCRCGEGAIPLNSLHEGVSEGCARVLLTGLKPWYASGTWLTDHLGNMGNTLPFEDGSTPVSLLLVSISCPGLTPTR